MVLVVSDCVLAWFLCGAVAGFLGCVLAIAFTMFQSGLMKVDMSSQTNQKDKITTVPPSSAKVVAEELSGTVVEEELQIMSPRGHVEANEAVTIQQKPNPSSLEQYETAPVQEKFVLMDKPESHPLMAYSSTVEENNSHEEIAFMGEKEQVISEACALETDSIEKVLFMMGEDRSERVGHEFGEHRALLEAAPPSDGGASDLGVKEEMAVGSGLNISDISARSSPAQDAQIETAPEPDRSRPSSLNERSDVDGTSTSRRVSRSVCRDALMPRIQEVSERDEVSFYTAKDTSFPLTPNSHINEQVPAVVSENQRTNGSAHGQHSSSPISENITRDVEAEYHHLIPNMQTELGSEIEVSPHVRNAFTGRSKRLSLDLFESERRHRSLDEKRTTKWGEARKQREEEVITPHRNSEVFATLTSSRGWADGKAGGSKQVKVLKSRLQRIFGGGKRQNECFEVWSDLSLPETMHRLSRALKLAGAFVTTNTQKCKLKAGYYPPNSTRELVLSILVTEHGPRCRIFFRRSVDDNGGVTLEEYDGFVQHTLHELIKQH